MTYDIHWNSENLELQSGETQIQYPRTTANQLILCARMNTWEQFLALLEKKTSPDQWDGLENQLKAYDKPTAWKFKEKIARLSTNE